MRYLSRGGTFATFWKQKSKTHEISGQRVSRIRIVRAIIHAFVILVFKRWGSNAWLLIGKLHAICNEFGGRGEWDPRLLLGNPATALSLSQYLKAVTAEQLQAQATPKQAIPFFVNDLLQLSLSIDLKMQSENRSLTGLF